MDPSDLHMSVVYECWYALRQSYLGTRDKDGPHDGKAIDGNIVSDWNYLANDVPAFKAVKGQHGEESSVCDYFGTDDEYALKSGIGRGGQCVFFAQLILRRGAGYTRLLPKWSDLHPADYPSARDAQPGDLVFHKSGTDSGQMAVSVKRLTGGIDVVDSNYVGYNQEAYSVGVRDGKRHSEVIGRHTVTPSQIRNSNWRTLRW